MFLECLQAVGLPLELRLEVLGVLSEVTTGRLSADSPSVSLVFFTS
jgi:hypothetical protein